MRPWKTACLLLLVIGLVGAPTAGGIELEAISSAVIRMDDDPATTRMLLRFDAAPIAGRTVEFAELRVPLLFAGGDGRPGRLAWGTSPIEWRGEEATWTGALSADASSMTTLREGGLLFSADGSRLVAIDITEHLQTLLATRDTLDFFIVALPEEEAPGLQAPPGQQGRAPNATLLVITSD